MRTKLVPKDRISSDPQSRWVNPMHAKLRLTRLQAGRLAGCGHICGRGFISRAAAGAVFATVVAASSYRLPPVMMNES